MESTAEARKAMHIPRCYPPGRTSRGVVRWLRELASRNDKVRSEAFACQESLPMVYFTLPEVSHCSSFVHARFNVPSEAAANLPPVKAPAMATSVPGEKTRSQERI